MENSEKIALASVLIAVISLIAFVAHPMLYTSQPTPVTPTRSPIITPTSTATPPPTPYIDQMDNMSGWTTYIDDETESSIDIESIPGRTGNAIAISYDLKEKGYVSILKEIKPEILSGKDGLRFFYKGSGRPNTLAVELVYSDPNFTCFGVKWNSSTAIDDWVSIEAPYTNFRCWWPNESCLHYGDKVDLEYVRRISFAIMNEPEAGDRYGSGRVIIDDVQGITS